MIKKSEVLAGLRRVWGQMGFDEKECWTFEGFVKDNYWSFRKWMKNERKRVSK